MNNRNTELIVATTTATVCLLLLALLAVDETKLELSKNKKKLWLLESATKQSSRVGEAHFKADDRLTQKPARR